MKFGFLNLSGFLIVAIMLIPNIIYARRFPKQENKCTSKPMLILEQIGRYGSMLLMVFPLLVWEFELMTPEAVFFWPCLCLTLLAAYLVFWRDYFRKQTAFAALWLAILPSAIFILRGLFLRHWLLAIFGAIFAVSHIYITYVNNVPEQKSR